ncbi:hypothetical protein M2428_000155 [Arthrobacter sp. ES3-54]|nr:hypothetical protein [Arthrobacter sp. ES3-54]
MPGWKVTTATRHLDKPIEMFGEQLDTVVSEITWTATRTRKVDVAPLWLWAARRQGRCGRR